MSEKHNPANRAPVELGIRKPMTGAERKLEVPSIPGYVCYWFNDYGGRVERAKEAGYEHVQVDELRTRSRNPADGPNTSGTDLGSIVSAVVGRDDEGKGLRAYLMKIREEWFKEDHEAYDMTVDKTIGDIQRNLPDTGGRDSAERYLKQSTLETVTTRRRL